MKTYMAFVQWSEDGEEKKPFLFGPFKAKDGQEEFMAYLVLSHYFETDYVTILHIVEINETELPVRFALTEGLDE